MTGKVSKKNLVVVHKITSQQNLAVTVVRVSRVCRAELPTVFDSR